MLPQVTLHVDREEHTGRWTSSGSPPAGAGLDGAHVGRAGVKAEPGDGAEIWFELPDDEPDEDRLV